MFSGTSRHWPVVRDWTCLFWRSGYLEILKIGRKSVEMSSEHGEMSKARLDRSHALRSFED